MISKQSQFKDVAMKIMKGISLLLMCSATLVLVAPAGLSQQTLSDLRSTLSPSSRSLLDDAKKKLQDGENDRALAIFEKLAAAETQSAIVQHYTAEAAYLCKKYDLVIKYCDQAIKIDKNSRESWDIRAHANLRLERFADAERDFTKELDIDQHQCDARYHRACCRRQMGRNSDALSDIREVRKSRNDKDAVYAHILILCDNLHLDEAQVQADGLVKSSPQYAEAHLVRGMVLLARGQDKSAEPAFAKAIELDQSIKPQLAVHRAEAQLMKAKNDAKK